MKKQLILWSRRIFTVGIFAMLVLGVVAVVLYVVAFLAGGEVAARITSWIMSGYFPVLFVLNIIFCVIGLLNVYLIGDRGFRFDTSTSATREK